MNAAVAILASDAAMPGEQDLLTTIAWCLERGDGVLDDREVTVLIDMIGIVDGWRPRRKQVRRLAAIREKLAREQAR